MKIETSKITKIHLSELEALDPITVILEDIAPRQGKIIIECYGESWSAYWDGMGNRTIAEFFCSCDEHYIAGKMSNMRSEIPATGQELIDAIKRDIISRRRANEFDKNAARELFNEIANSYAEGWSDIDSSVLRDIYGYDFYRQLPEVPNHQYQYLCRIIKAVQAGLQNLNKQEAA